MVWLGLAWDAVAAKSADYCPQLALTPLARLAAQVGGDGSGSRTFGSLVRCAERAARYWNDQWMKCRIKRQHSLVFSATTNKPRNPLALANANTKQPSAQHNTTQHSSAQHKVIEEKPVLSFPKYPHPPDVWVLFALAGSDGIVSYRIVSYRTISHSTVPVGLWRTLLSDFRFGWIFGFVSSVLSFTMSTRRRPPEISYDLISPGSYLFKFIANFICCCSSAWHSFVQVRHCLSSLENS